MPDGEYPKTLSVPEAGRLYFNLSRNGSYDAAKKGLIPTIPIGRLLRVPVRALERMLDDAVSNASKQRKYDAESGKLMGPSERIRKGDLVAS